MKKQDQETLKVLERIFGTADKVKIMRLFLFSESTYFTLKDIVSRTQIKEYRVKPEILNLEKAGMVIKKEFSVEALDKSKKAKKKKATGWILDKSFPYSSALHNLLVSINPLRHEDISSKITKTGRIKMLLISGVFIQEPESRVDMLIVGDLIKDAQLNRTLKEIEAELGSELRYSLLSTDDYEYRLGMCDKLIRDILDFPHKILVDKLSTD